MLKSVKNETKVAFFQANAGFVMYLCIWKRASAQNGQQMAANSPESFRIAMKALSKKSSALAHRKHSFRAKKASLQPLPIGSKSRQKRPRRT
jgi:hypothetical protein